jgi:hypothetical protein
MKLYIANGVYFGTQAEAKAETKSFEQVEVPTDKAGLIGYLNEVTRFDLGHAPCENIEAPARDINEDRAPRYAEQSVAFEDQWEQFPLALQLHYAALAVEAARDAYPKITTPSTRKASPVREEDVDAAIAEEEVDPFA